MPLAPSSAAIIAIGTEVTSGQILNSNTTWIANQLQNFRIETAWHFAVGDDVAVIREALQFASAHASLIFLCGGLGPTSDDLTRNAVTDWYGVSLKFDEAAWQHVLSRASQLKLTALPEHRQQCQFPEGARLLSNRAGSAYGFLMEPRANHREHIWCLPGPPHELQAIWEDHVQADLRRLSHGAERRLYTWDCVNVTESQLASAVETALAGMGAELGYRIHAPYVECKLWANDDEEAKPLLAKIEPVLDKWLIARNGEDIAQKFIALCGARHVCVADHLTRGTLGARLNKALALQKDSQGLTLTVVSGSPQNATGEASLAIALQGDDAQGTWTLSCRIDGQSFSCEQKSAFQGERHRPRNRQIAAELALKQVATWLEG